MKKIKIPILSLLTLMALMPPAGCKKFLTIPPPQNNLVNRSAFQDEPTATATVLGLYEKMMETTGIFANGGITFYTGLSGDELITTPNNATNNEFYHNEIKPTNTGLKTALWANGYQLLYQDNAILEGLTGAPLRPEVKNQLLGEVKFVRAFFHFYLVNLFGDIPLVLTADYSDNAVKSRTAAADVYVQVIRDLQDAVQLLPDDYVDQTNQPTSAQRVRPNRATANALLARVYLYITDWADAAQTATLLLDQAYRYPLSPDLNLVFLAGSTEGIWQLMPVMPGRNTGEGSIFIQTSGDPVYGFLDSNLLSSFEPGDQRLTDWVSSYSNGSQTFYYPAKYKINFADNVTEYNTVFRIAEQFLIRAEARNEMGDLAGAAEDLDRIRDRAGLGPTGASDQAGMRMAIQDERRHELFCEWGHRWMDLKRTGRIDAVLSVKKMFWVPTDSLYPIPQTELQNDIHLLQNPGY